MASDLDGAVALVTGGARGIGAAIARAYVENGGRVLVGDIDDDRGRALAAELGRGATYRQLDVTRDDDVAAAVDAVVDGEGRLDAVFANAGAVGVTGPVASTSLAHWTSTLDPQVTSAFLTVKHAVLVMEPQGRGAIVCTASVASLRGGLGPHAYTAAKHALLGLVRSVAVEVAPSGLRINAVAPGGTVSSLSAAAIGGDPDDLEAARSRLAAGSASGVPTTAEDVAAAAVSWPVRARPGSTVPVWRSTARTT